MREDGLLQILLAENLPSAIYVWLESLVANY